MVTSTMDTLNTQITMTKLTNLINRTRKAKNKEDTKNIFDSLFDTMDKVNNHSAIYWLNMNGAFSKQQVLASLTNLLTIDHKLIPDKFVRKDINLVESSKDKWFYLALNDMLYYEFNKNFLLKLIKSLNNNLAYQIRMDNTKKHQTMDVDYAKELKINKHIHTLDISKIQSYVLKYLPMIQDINKNPSGYQITVMINKEAYYTLRGSSNSNINTNYVVSRISRSNGNIAKPICYGNSIFDALRNLVNIRKQEAHVNPNLTMSEVNKLSDIDDYLNSFQFNSKVTNYDISNANKAKASVDKLLYSHVKKED